MDNILARKQNKDLKIKNAREWRITLLTSTYLASNPARKKQIKSFPILEDTVSAFEISRLTNFLQDKDIFFLKS